MNREWPEGMAIPTLMFWTIVVNILVSASNGGMPTNALVFNLLSAAAIACVVNEQVEEVRG